MKIVIIYESITGNTKLLAEQIRNCFEKSDIVYCGDVKNYNLELDADLYFVGSWTNRGDASNSIKKFLECIKNKKIFLFGTCGFGGSSKYFNVLEERFKSNIHKSNKYLGCFICQGKMPMSVKNRYISMIKENPDDKNLEVSLKNFDEALTHPDKADLKKLEDLVNNLKNNI